MAMLYIFCLAFPLPDLSPKMSQKALENIFGGFVFVILFLFGWLVVCVSVANTTTTTTKRQQQNKQQKEELGCSGALQAPHHPKPSKTQPKAKPPKKATHKIKQTNTHTHTHTHTYARTHARTHAH